MVKWRLALAVAALLLAGASIYLMAVEAAAQRRDARQDPLEAANVAGIGAKAGGAEETAIGGGLDGEATGSTSDEAAASNTGAVRVRGVLAYPDGSPAGGVFLQVAVARPIKTKKFWNRDYPDITVWMSIVHRTFVTDPHGRFQFGELITPEGYRTFLFSETDTKAHVLAEFRSDQNKYEASPKCLVTGRLLSPDGKPMPGTLVTGQLGRPEEWNTRVQRLADIWVDVRGELDVDQSALVEDTSSRDGNFSLSLVAGRNSMSFGFGREGGTMEIQVPAGKLKHDLGDIKPSGNAAKSRTNHTLRGIVRDASGRPFKNAQVLIWAGSVGDPTDEARTDENGRFEFDELKSTQAIVWAVSTHRPYVVSPDQSSGTVDLPCNSLVSLSVARSSEYHWLQPRGVTGFWMFFRDGILMGGASLDGTKRVGVPWGDWRILVVQLGKILERRISIREGGESSLSRKDFSDVTGQ
ncbi:MAG: carboxypeptidase-like regulatory domain-containing protein [Planctomycetota bacterium]